MERYPKNHTTLHFLIKIPPRTTQKSGSAICLTLVQLHTKENHLTMKTSFPSRRIVFAEHCAHMKCIQQAKFLKKHNPRAFSAAVSVYVIYTIIQHPSESTSFVSPRPSSSSFSALSFRAFVGKIFKRKKNTTHRRNNNQKTRSLFVIRNVLTRCKNTEIFFM